jgi:hypothetical protein
MPDNPFSDPEISDQIKVKVLRLQAASLEWDDNPAGRSFDDHIVETLVETLDAHAVAYLRKVVSKDLISQYVEYLHGVGSVLIRNAEQRSFLSDPYSEERLRAMAENSGSLMNRVLFLKPEERESEIQKEFERLRDKVMPKAAEWHQWHSQIRSRIEARYEARCRRWEADAIERLRNRGITAGAMTALPSWKELQSEFLQYAAEHDELSAVWRWVYPARTLAAAIAGALAEGEGVDPMDVLTRMYQHPDVSARPPAPTGQWNLEGRLPASQDLFRVTAARAAGRLPNPSDAEPWRLWLDHMRAEGYTPEMAARSKLGQTLGPYPHGFEDRQIEHLFKVSADFCLVRSLADSYASSPSQANDALNTPAPDEAAAQRLTSPSRWDELEIFVPNDFEVQITLPDHPRRTVGFEEMGFADRRGKAAKKPNTLWDLLLAFARLKGRIENPKQAGLSDWRKVEQRVWGLNTALEVYFRISDSPIRYINKGYESTFKIKANPFSGV